MVTQTGSYLIEKAAIGSLDNYLQLQIDKNIKNLAIEDSPGISHII